MNEQYPTTELTTVSSTIESVSPEVIETVTIDRPQAEADTISGEPLATEVIKKTRIPRAVKVPVTAEANSVTAIVERVVRLSMLDDAHTAALGRLFNISLPDEHIARLTRLTAISLSPIGTNSAEALAIVLSLESANLIHVGVQLGRLQPTTLPDVFRCAHALIALPSPTASPVPLAKGDQAVFSVADVLATLTTDHFVLARVLKDALA